MVTAFKEIYELMKNKWWMKALKMAFAFAVMLILGEVIFHDWSQNLMLGIAMLLAMPLPYVFCAWCLHLESTQSQPGLGNMVGIIVAACMLFLIGFAISWGLHAVFGINQIQARDWSLGINAMVVLLFAMGSAWR